MTAAAHIITEVVSEVHKRAGQSFKVSLPWLFLLLLLCLSKICFFFKKRAKLKALLWLREISESEK